MSKKKKCLFFIQNLKYYSDLEIHSEWNEALQRATILHTAQTL